jgi:PKD repeat protein
MKVLRVLLIATGSLAFVCAPSAQATTSNVVPNPGFEQGGCGGTPILCGWMLASDPESYIAQDMANYHSGSASVYLQWSTSFSGGWGSVAAYTDSASCVTIGPGVHPASFWHANALSWLYPVEVSMGAFFFSESNCAGTASQASFWAWASNPESWEQVSGILVAPAGTQSARFSVGAGTTCDYAGGCFVSANFDDVYVEETVIPTPVITSFTPTSGPFGTLVTITGANFTGATSVKFNGTADLSFVVNSSTEITAHVPPGAFTAPISVTTPDGTAVSSLWFTVTPPVPVITSFTPTSGPVGTLVTITGANFTGFTSSVKFNGTADPSFVVNSSTDITAHVPAGATTGPISVTTQHGTAISSSSFTVTPPPPPPPPPPPNVAPVASLSPACTGLTCTFDSSGSSDSDGTIVQRAWSFGDGTTGSGMTVQHTYNQAGVYTVSLTVTDDDGADDDDSKSIALITLTANGYRVHGLQKVDLAWTGSSAVDVFRDAMKIATVQATAYTDNLNRRRPGSYVYAVCAVGTSVCSNNATVTF